MSIVVNELRYMQYRDDEDQIVNPELSTLRLQLQDKIRVEGVKFQRSRLNHQSLA